MDTLLEAILDDDCSKVEKLLLADATLATRVIDAPKLYESKIFHWICVGDTAAMCRGRPMSSQGRR
ncbi:MAG: hypothetical protein NT013_14390 [Planctomycetia bacterium]|nr:hypothetical protein [Planctomycetia bacterium]